jgi:hypothetical protein
MGWIDCAFNIPASGNDTTASERGRARRSTARNQHRAVWPGRIQGALGRWRRRILGTSRNRQRQCGRARRRSGGLRCAVGVVAPAPWLGLARHPFGINGQREIGPVQQARALDVSASSARNSSRLATKDARHVATTASSKAWSVSNVSPAAPPSFS